MAKKQLQGLSIDNFLRNNLQAKLREEIGRKQIERVEMPSCFATALNPIMRLRPYQMEAFQYFFSYWENDFEGKAAQPQLLFHMATGSGKTLIMAGIILYLYEQGYRNFLFFVNSGNVIEKTKDNFFNTASSKYLFGPTITIGNKRVEVKQVENFQNSDPDAINFCLQTIQGLHIDLNTPRENGVTYDDFRNLKVALIADEAHLSIQQQRSQRKKVMILTMVKLLLILAMTMMIWRQAMTGKLRLCAFSIQILEMFFSSLQQPKTSLMPPLQINIKIR